ncbi:MAG TPA: hypothetical protein DCS30_02220 [Rhizobiales bacterium]|nr:hypothetical protein [Hyphomicrobiales bacterium]
MQGVTHIADIMAFIRVFILWAPLSNHFSHSFKATEFELFSKTINCDGQQIGQNCYMVATPGIAGFLYLCGNWSRL